MSCSLVPAAPARRRRTWTTYAAEYVKPTRCMSYSSSYPEKRAPADGTYCGEYVYEYTVGVLPCNSTDDQKSMLIPPEKKSDSAETQTTLPRHLLAVVYLTALPLLPSFAPFSAP